MATPPPSSPLRHTCSPTATPGRTLDSNGSSTSILNPLPTPPDSPQNNGVASSTPALASDLYRQFPINARLNETRKVLLQPGAWDDEIKCQLEVVGLDDDPEFEALSYVWGDSAERRTISLNDRPFQVTVNLEAALRRFRNKHAVRSLWADGLSINQPDISERNQQVALMRTIYQNCKGVLIYLGEITSAAVSSSSTELSTWSTKFDDTDVTVTEEDEQKIQHYQETWIRYYRLPEALRHNVEQDFELGAFCLISLLAQNKHFKDTDIPPLLAHLGRKKLLQALRHMMQLTWWRRQWVIQETVLAPVAAIYYGRFEIPWEMLTVAAKNYQIHRHTCCSDQYARLPPEDVQGIELFAYTHQDVGNWRAIWLHGQPTIGLLPLLWQFRGRDSKNPMDKIYALLPLVTYWDIAGALTPHYDWTVPQVYREVVVKMVNVNKSLLVLMGNTEKSDNLRAQLPSWIPDWTAKPHPKELERLDRAQLYHASPPLEAKSKICRFPTEKILLVYGIQHQIVTSVGCLMNCEDDDGSGAVFKEWHILAGLDEPASTAYVAGGTLRAAYWRTICMDTKYIGKDTDEDNLPMYRKDYERAPPSYGSDYDGVWLKDTSVNANANANTNSTQGAIVRLSQRGREDARRETFDELRIDPRGRLSVVKDRAPASGSPGARNDAVAADIAIRSATAHRRLFLTEDGYMGLGPASMQAGDVVFLLRGGHTPFLLRHTGHMLDQRRKCYELVGDCYVDGIMDGEAWTDVTEDIYLV